MKEKEKNIIEDNKIEHCHWYVAVGRIIFILIAAIFPYAFFLKVMELMLKVLNEQTGCWDWLNNIAQNNPILTFVLLGVGYIIFLFLFIYNFTKSVINNITQV